MQSQWIDEFDQMMWEQCTDVSDFRTKLETFCLTTLRKKGVGAVNRLSQHVHERKRDFEVFELKCGLIERCTVDDDARAVVSGFGKHYKRMSARFMIADQTLGAMSEIL